MAWQRSTSSLLGLLGAGARVVVDDREGVVRHLASDHLELRAAPHRRRMHTSSMAACAVMLVAACSGKGARSSANDRGAGLEVEKLSADQQAAAYATALGGAFDLGPSLVLLLDPDMLPRERGVQPLDTIPTAVARALASRGVIQGSCAAVPASQREVPVCKAQSAGYKVQFSPVFRLARDTVQVYLVAERYRPSSDTTGYQPPLEFEQRYALVRSGRQWRAVRKERLTH